MEQLLKADIIFKVKYPTWLANPIMVKNHGGGWRICMDFIDLRKHYSKDCYPLSSINQIIEVVVGYGALSFVNLYKGYHQVFMKSDDASKTSFNS